MCPSYMATLDEAHSTKAVRLNVLRLAMTGQLGQSDSATRASTAILPPLQCRACKAECPVGVDVGGITRASSSRITGGQARTPLGVCMLGAAHEVAKWAVESPDS